MQTVVAQVLVVDGVWIRFGGLEKLPGDLDTDSVDYLIACTVRNRIWM